MELKDIAAKIRVFRDERDWAQFHNPKDMAIAISIEVSELLEHFLWKNPEEVESRIEAKRSELPKTPPANSFPIRSPEEAANCPNAVMIFDIKIAEGDFSKEQWLQDCQYAELPDHFTAKSGFFLAQVVGESMNKRIPNGSWCLFREPSDGSRNGKVVIVQSRDIQDLETGSYTVKRYSSDKQVTELGWIHQRIMLSPDSDRPCFQPISLTPSENSEFHVVGEYVTTIGWNENDTNTQYSNTLSEL